MRFEDITEKDKTKYNKLVSHPLQSWEWGEFREKTGVKVVRRVSFNEKKIVGGFTITLHNIPKLPYKIGYLPKGDLPTEDEVGEIIKIGQENKCIFVQIEPNVIRQIINQEQGSTNEGQKKKKQIKQFEGLIHDSKFHLQPSFHPLFTKYNFVLDITPSEEELLKSFHAKTRYNIKVARDKHNVRVVFDSSRESFVDYLQLLEETTSRQAFYAHSPEYHKKLYETLPHTFSKDKLTYHIARALYTDSSGKEHTLAAWVLFSFGKTLYYPYGASSNLYRFTMASNLICWEVIKYGKQLGLDKFDMWGALGPDPDKSDAWYGFHRFKAGYSPEHLEYVGSYDIVTNPALYNFYKVADRVRWAYLGLKKKIR